MSEQHEIDVIAHPQFRDEVEAWLAATPRENLRIHWLNVSAALNPWNPERGERGIRIHYLLWLRKAMHYAKRLHASCRFDLVHHISLGSISAPSRLWQLGCPLIWGPLGGGQVPPKALMPLFGRQQWIEQLRSLRIRLLKYSPSFKLAVRNSALLIATNRDTAQVLSDGGAHRVELMPDQPVRSNFVCSSLPERQQGHRLKLIWAGRLIRWKGLDLAILALKRLGATSHVELSIVGGGPMREYYERIIAQSALAGIVTFHGAIPWSQMPAHFRSADAFLFTSVRESFGSVLLEAMGQALPIITLDLAGAQTFLSSEAAIKIPVHHLDQTVSDIASAIELLRDNPTKRARMGAAAYKFANLNTAEFMLGRWNSYYDEARIGRATPRFEADYFPRPN
jgi:glycosyltransferase involved in cell wall biosynthesis